VTPIDLPPHRIDATSPCFVIAEAGVNHDGDPERALELVRQAAAVGADCVKFQTFTAAGVATRAAPKAAYQLEVTDRAESQFEMLRKLELPQEVYRDLIALSTELGLTFLSTPYGEADADFLEELGCPAFKIASGQLVETPLLRHVARKGRPIILSTGMGTMDEVAEAVAAIREEGLEELVVLQCTTNYPADLRDANLRAMNEMGRRLDVWTGYSDHVPSNEAALASVALGARVLEKHFTLDRSLPGPDHSTSLDVAQFRSLVEGVRAVEAALGSAEKAPTAAELANRPGMRRSIVVLRDLSAGAVLAREDLGFKRPASGIAPKRLDAVVGRRLTTALIADTVLREPHLAEEGT
jgi:N,N'-diacetyllegionaminate synthase